MQAVLFDIDGTLITTGGAGTAALRRAMTTAFGVDNPTSTVPVTGRTDRAIIRDLLQFHGLEDTTANWERLRAAYLGHLPQILAEYRGRVLPGILSLLKGLQQREGLLLGLLTGNTREGARLKLSHFGLHEHFTFGGFGDLHFNRDDVAREAFSHVTAKLTDRVDPRRIWVVGDTPLDIQYARAIGANSLAVATGTHKLEELAACHPDLLLADLSGDDVLGRLLHVA
jgi:phosphoglycolate phosphatase